jgi:hypothetical protein
MQRYIKEDPTAPGSPIRAEDDQNVDQLIPKLNFFYYCGNECVGQVKKTGILTPASMLKQFPDRANEIKKVYEHVWSCPIKRNSVMAFFCRIPIDLPSTKRFCQINTPVRVSVTKLLRAKSPYEAYGFNFPNNPDKMIKLHTGNIDKLTKMEDRFYECFKNSKDPYFRDVPQVAIHCGDVGRVQSFACRVLTDEN